jgi:hypothetical protein
MTTARNLKVGDTFKLEICCEVAAVTAEGERIKVTLGGFYDTSSLVFPEDGCVLEFTCKPSRLFSTWNCRTDDVEKELV